MQCIIMENTLIKLTLHDETKLLLVIKTMSIPSGQYSFNATDIFQGLVPCQRIMGLASSATYIGN